MVSRDSGIRLMMLLLIFPQTFKATINKPSEVGRNGDGRLEELRRRKCFCRDMLLVLRMGLRQTKIKIGGCHDFTQEIIEVVTPSIGINAALEDENYSPRRAH